MADFVSGTREPFFAVDFDNTLANTAGGELVYTALIIGQRTAAAAALPGAPAANTLHRVTSEGDVVAVAGRGSILHRQAIAWYASNRQTELYIGLLDDDGGGTAATGTITVTGPATASGTIAYYLGGVRRTVAVNIDDSADDIAAAINADIALALDSPITSTVLANVVTTEFVHAGEVGNAFDIRHSFNDGEALPAGVGLAIVQTTGGTSNPSLDALITAMGDQWFNIITHPYTDATSLTALETELASRDVFPRMIDGYALTSAVGSIGTLAALGNSRNSRFTVIHSQPGENPLTPPMEFAAEYAALVAISGQARPNLPLHRIAMANAIAPAEADLFTRDERNMLTFDGVATSNVVAGVVQTSATITTFQLNASGLPDDSYLYLETSLTLSLLRFSWRVWLASRYPRALLAEDGVAIASGVKVMTPSQGKLEAVAWFREQESQSYVQDAQQYIDDLDVQIDGSNPRQLNLLLSPNLVKQLVGTSTIMQFR